MAMGHMIECVKGRNEGRLPDEIVGWSGWSQKCKAWVIQDLIIRRARRVWEETGGIVAIRVSEWDEGKLSTDRRNGMWWSRLVVMSIHQ